MRVLTLGSFDLFHVGHVNLLRACRLVGGTGAHVTVALNNDEFIEAFKNHPPVIPLRDRISVVAGCRYVDEVTVNCQTVKGSSAEATIDEARPDLIVVGSDWQERDYLGQLGTSQRYLDSIACAVVYVPYTQGISSTAIRERMAA